MPDVLLSFDENKSIASKNAIQSIGVNVIQPIVNSYATLNIAVLNADDLQPLFKDPEGFIFDKMTGGSLMLGGVEADRTKAIELLKKPEGYDNFVQLIKDAIADLKGRLLFPGNYPVTPDNIDSYFELDGENTVVFKQEMKDKIEAGCKRYAKSDLAKSMLEFAQEIIDKHDELELGDYTKSIGSGLQHVIANIINWKYGSSTLTVNSEAIEKLNSGRFDL